MFAEDLSQFKDATHGFAWAVTIGGVTGTALNFVESPGDVLGLVASSDPELLVDSADFPAIAVGDAVSVNATSYTIIGLYPDETGVMRVALK